MFSFFTRSCDSKYCMLCSYFSVHLDISYLRDLHKSPLKPAIHPVKQDPLILKHWSISRQCPHVSSHLLPYEPLSHSKTIINYMIYTMSLFELSWLGTDNVCKQ